MKSLLSELRQQANPEKAKVLQRFFKKGPGEYGEGDIFLGITVPQTRKIASQYTNLSLNDIEALLKSKVHEERLCALFLLVHKYQKGDDAIRLKIVNFYLSKAKHVNNWDLVDSSAHQILGDSLLNKDSSILYTLAKSENIWERRISIVSTYAFIRNKKFSDTLKISEILLQDKHDLIHKAVGWMLREVGKKDINVLETFLEKHYKKMPRTMLRYAIEKLPEGKRKEYLKRKI